MIAYDLGFFDTEKGSAVLFLSNFCPLNSVFLVNVFSPIGDDASAYLCSKII